MPPGSIRTRSTYAADMSDTRITIAATALTGDHLTPLRRLGFQPNPADLTRFQTRADPAVFEYLKTHTITYDRERFESTTAQEIRLRVEAVHRWYVHDWNTLDNKIRSSIVEGVSVAARDKLIEGAEDRRLSWRSPGAGLEYARRHQPGARPGDRRYAQKCVARSGSTGSGKTTLLNALIELLPDDERMESGRMCTGRRARIHPTARHGLAIVETAMRVSLASGSWIVLAVARRANLDFRGDQGLVSGEPRSF